MNSGLVLGLCDWGGHFRKLGGAALFYSGGGGGKFYYKNKQIQLIIYTINTLKEPDM